MKKLQTIKKSPNDKLIYDAFELSNKMKVIFIEDSSVQKSVAVIHVGVGAMQDPIEF